MEVVASAPAKVILFGEHFVVHGEPAIALAIDKRVYVKASLRDDGLLYLRLANVAGYFKGGLMKVEAGSLKEVRFWLKPFKRVVEKVLEIRGENVGLNVEVDLTVPIAAGLGSSAATAAATAAAIGALLNVKLSKEDIFRIAYEAEKILHGTPSGVDPAASTFGGALLFQVNAGFKPLNVKADVPLIVGDTGVRRPTRVQVANVRNVKDKYPRIAEFMMLTAREIVLKAVEAMEEGDLRTVGDLMNLNHALLYGLGVSHESLERLIEVARKAGALGAKLTGAGGGGCMIALADEGRIENVLKAIRKAGGKPFVVKRADEGVRVERA